MLDWKDLHNRFNQQDGQQRSEGGVELEAERASEVTAKLKSLADELNSGGSHAKLDSELRKLYSQLPHCIYRDVVICAGYLNERCMNGEKKSRQDLMKVLRMQMQ